MSKYFDDVEFINWIDSMPELKLSKNSLTVLKERYLRKDDDGNFIETPKQLFGRVAWHLSIPEKKEDQIDFATDVYLAMATGKAMFNTPTLFNAGTHNGLGLSACYILEPEDSLESIMQVCKDLALIQKCIPKDQLIYSSQGKVKAGLLKTGDKIWTPEGMKTIKQVHNPGSKPCYEVTVNGKTCQMAGTHKILSKNKYKETSTIDYTPLDKLSEGSMVSFYSKKPDTNNDSLPIGFVYSDADTSGKEVMYHDISIPVTLTENLAYLLGLWQGNGSKDDLGIRFHNTDVNLCNQFTECIESVFNTKKFGYYAQKRKVKDDIEICFNSKKISSFFDFLGMRKDKSSLPEWLLNSADRYKWAFLQGLLDIDGCVTEKDVIAVSTKHKNIVLSIQSILDSLGIGSTINQHKKDEEYYNLTVLSCDVYKYSEGMPFKTAKVEKLNNIPRPKQSSAPHNSRWSPIQTIKYIGDKDCVDFTLEDNSLHIYMVGDLITHNSGGGVGYNFSKLRAKNSLVKSCGATTDGPLPFIDMYCATTNAIQQGAKRRGAQMGMLDINHPDIWDFIQAKSDMKRWQNMNISPKVSDSWMSNVLTNPNVYHAVEHKKWGQGYLFREKGKVEAKKTEANKNSITVGNVFDEICKRAWSTGEPGLFFKDRVDRDWVFSESGKYKIVATNPCVTASTWVHTTEGPQQVKNLISNQFSMPWADGKTYTSTEDGFFSSGTKEVWQLRTKEGYRIELTSDHKVFTPEGKVPAIELKKGDKILLNLTDQSWEGEGNGAEGYLLGYWLGDGTYDKRDDRAILDVWELENQKSGVLTVIEKSIADVLNSKIKLSEVHSTDTYKKYRGRSKELARLIDSWQLSKERISSRIEQGSREFQASFLGALFDAYGSIQGSLEKGFSVRLAQSNWFILHTVQRMLTRFGISSRVLLRREAHDKDFGEEKGGVYPVKDQYGLIISSAHLKMFYKNIGFRHLQKADKLEEALNSYTKGPYSGLTEATFEELFMLNTQEVFDCQIPGLTLFDANGCQISNCGEIPGEDGMTCNLASINIAAINSEVEFKNLVGTMIRALDNVVEMNEFPVEKIAKVNKATRRIGLGIMGWADHLFKKGIPYNSKDANDLAEQTMKKMATWSRQTSKKLGKEKGNFGAFKESDFYLNSELKTPYMRNAYVNMHAPTGTISIISDCSCGIEPIYSLAFERDVMQDNEGKTKKLVEVNKIFKNKLDKFYSPEQTAEIISYAAHNGTIQTFKSLYTHTKEGKPDSIWSEILRVFVTASDVDVEGHIKMQASWQKYTDQAISKTINIPNTATIDDVKKAYKLAWQLGCKGITVYRDGCRDNIEGQVQPMKLSKKQSKETIEDTDDIQSSLRVRQPTPLGKLHVNIVHDDGIPKEIFAQLSKSGDMAAADLEAICRLSSLWLRSGGSFDALISQLEHIGSSIMLPTKTGKIKSLPDGLAVALKRYKKYINTGDKQFKQIDKNDSILKKICPDCGSEIKMVEGCEACINPSCGYSKC